MGGIECEGLEKVVAPLDNAEKLIPSDKQPQNEDSSPAKSVFDIPGLSAPKLGFMSVSGDGGPSFSSIFSSPPQMPQVDGGGLLSGFKAFSSGLFNEEKRVVAKEESTAASMFRKKIGFPWPKDTAEPTKPQEHPVITSQPKSIDGRPSEPEKSKSELDESNQISYEVKEPADVMLKEAQHLGQSPGSTALPPAGNSMSCGQHS